MEKLSASLFGALVSISLLAPFTLHAYLSPGQVFGDSSGAAHGAAGENLQPPPTQREGEAVVIQQQQQAAEQRQEAQQELIPVDAPPVDTYVPPEQPAESKGLFDQNAQYELRQERIEEERAQAPTIIIGGDTEVRDSNGNVLHSGAPRTSSTGPASVLGGIALLLAAVCTFAYSHYRSRYSPVAV